MKQNVCYCVAPPKSNFSMLNLLIQLHHCFNRVCSLRKETASCGLWMRSNRLQLNTAKMEVLWCATSRRQHQIPRAPKRVGGLHNPCRLRTGSGHLSELRHLHEVTCFDDGVEQNHFLPLYLTSTSQLQVSSPTKK